MKIDEVLERVWNAALDASSSSDFRNSNGDLDEEAYLRYKRNLFAWARDQFETNGRGHR